MVVFLSGWMEGRLPRSVCLGNISNIVIIRCIHIVVVVVVLIHGRISKRDDVDVMKETVYYVITEKSEELCSI